MKNWMMILVLIAALALSGCDAVNTGELMQQVETIASQVDVKSIITTLVESIDWEELKTAAKEGYDALTAKYPALKQENIKAYLKENGLKLTKELYGSANAEQQESARKIGQILAILYPDLSEEVSSIIGE